MNNKEPRVLCLTPTPGKKGTRILKWKYVLIRNAILEALAENENGVHFMDLTKHVEKRLSESELNRLGSLRWYVTTVKLDLEVQGEIYRVPGSKPQRLRRT